MKRLQVFILFVVFLFCMSGCTNLSATYDIFPMQQGMGTVGKDLVVYYLENSDYFPSFDVLKGNRPDILSYLINVTPEQLRDKCEIYYFYNSRETAGLYANTFLVYKNQVYPLGDRAFGGYGVTEFAYMHNGSDGVLYYIYSSGSGVHRSRIGAFDFKTCTITDYGKLLGEFANQDISFCLKNNGHRLAICEAEIRSNYEILDISITKGEIIYQDVSKISFVPLES